MSVSQETVDKIQNFANQRQKAEGEYESQPLSPASLQSYSRKLDETLKGLQNQVKRQEGELQKVRPMLRSTGKQTKTRENKHLT